MEASTSATQLAQVHFNKSKPAQKREFNRQYLINKLNFLNFQDETILINLKHPNFNQTFSIQAIPLPCSSDELTCRWANSPATPPHIISYIFENLLINDGQKLLSVEPEVIELTNHGAKFRLPEFCHEVTTRKTRRYLSHGIQAQLMQNSSMFSGDLLDFSAVSFQVELTAHAPQTFQWINPHASATLILSDGKEIIYSGECIILKQTSNQEKRRFVLRSENSQLPRFKPKEFRGTRQELVPSPNVTFKHPMIQKLVDLKVVNVSGNGVSVEEDENSTVLLAGMIIPELNINFANSFKITCKAQVVYRRDCKNESSSGPVRCGLTILDMDPKDHVKLLGILHQAKNENTYICNHVDLNDLWKFFFESGFIYPKKYAYIQENKEKLKQTYEKLYTQSPNIARHFIYQDKGTILGHMAIVRFYENAWLIHHHAANSEGQKNAGLGVLNQIGRFINDSHSLNSVRMNFVCCYYRPENKFPNHVFGGVAKTIKDPKACSTDLFAYLHFNQEEHSTWEINSPWTLSKTRPDDLAEFELFYEHESGGLLPNALDLEPGMIHADQISQEFHNIGLSKERHLFSLKREDKLNAIFIVNNTDLGLNMSELTNAIKVFVLETENVKKDIFFQVISLLSKNFKKSEAPVLVFPHNYVKEQKIEHEKNYNFWILNTQYTDNYFKALKRLLRFIQH